jgi:hypothetical protein
MNIFTMKITPEERVSENDTGERPVLVSLGEKGHYVL